jgi:hypothetical protein
LDVSASGRNFVLCWDLSLWQRTAIEMDDAMVWVLTGTNKLCTVTELRVPLRIALRLG